MVGDIEARGHISGIGGKSPQFLVAILLTVAVVPIPVIAPSAVRAIPLLQCAILGGGLLSLKYVRSHVPKSGKALIACHTAFLVWGLVAHGAGDVSNDWRVIAWEIANFTLVGVAIAIASAFGRTAKFETVLRATGVVVSGTALLKALAVLGGVQVFEGRVQSTLIDGVNATRALAGNEDLALALFVVLIVRLLSGRPLDLRASVFLPLTMTHLTLAASRNLVFLAGVGVAVALALRGLSREARPRRVQLSRGSRAGGFALAIAAVSVWGFAPTVLEGLGRAVDGFGARVVGQFDLVPQEGTSWDYRLLEVRAAQETFDEHSVAGVGLGRPYRSPFPTDDVTAFGQAGPTQYIHNSYWWVLAKTGVVGAALYFGPIVSILLASLRTIARWQSEQQAAFIIVLLELLRAVITPSLNVGLGPVVVGCALMVLTGRLRPSFGDQPHVRVPPRGVRL